MSIRASIFAIASLAFAFSTPAFSAEAMPAPVKQTMQHFFPGAKTDVVSTRKINGVTVYDIKVTTKDGESVCTLSEHGDMILGGRPQKPTELPPAVQDIVSGLFNKSPSDVDLFTITRYDVDASVNGKSFRLQFDGTGRLRDIITQQELRGERNAHPQAASEAEKKAIEPLIGQHFANAKVGKIDKAESPGFFYVEFTADKGQHGSIILNEKNEVEQLNETMAEGDLPAPIRDAISAHIKNAKIGKVQRAVTAYYQLVENYQGANMVVKVQPNGDVMAIDTEGEKAENQAMTAGHKIAPHN